VYVNIVGAVIGAVIGAILVFAFFRYGDRVNWRKVNKYSLASSIPFGTIVFGMSWPEFERGIIGMIALTFFLSWVTDVFTRMAAWRADEKTPSAV
jgi:hypothetical protein